MSDHLLNKIYHMAMLMRKTDGAVSPLCADKPRALNLRRSTWTIRPEAVTCKKCIRILKNKETDANLSS